MLYPTNPACSTPKQSDPLQPGENTEQTNALPSKLALCAHNIQTRVSITTTWGPIPGSPFLVHKEVQNPVIIWGEEVGCRAQLHHVLDNFFPLSLQKWIHLLGHPQALQTRQPVRMERDFPVPTQSKHILGKRRSFHQLSPAISVSEPPIPNRDVMMDFFHSVPFIQMKRRPPQGPCRTTTGMKHYRSVSSHWGRRL